MIELGAFADSLGLILITASGDRVSGRMTVHEGSLQPLGLVNGGVHCAVVETLASVGGTLWWGERGSVVGVNNSTDFFRATRLGDELTAEALPIHRGRSQQLWRVETCDARMRMVAVGQVRLQNLTG